MSRGGGTTVPGDRRWRIKCAWMVVAAFALLVNGVTVTVLLSNSDSSASSRGVNGVFDDSEATSALELAEQQALGVVSLDADSEESDIAALANRTTAKFRTEFTGFAESLLDELRVGGVEVSARVAAGGISELSGDRATVLVATSGTSSSTTEPESRPRDLQMRIVVTRIDDDWRVDDLEFL